jgi:hypothetical protein
VYLEYHSFIVRNSSHLLPLSSSYGVLSILEFRVKTPPLWSVHLGNQELSILIKQQEEEYSWMSWKLKWNPKREWERIQFQFLLNQLNQEIRELNQCNPLEKKEKWIKYFAISRKDIPTSEWTGMKKLLENEEMYLEKFHQMKEWMKCILKMEQEDTIQPIFHLLKSMELYFKILFEEIEFIKKVVLRWIKEGNTEQHSLLLEYFTRKNELPTLEEIQHDLKEEEENTVTMNLLEERIISSNHSPSLHVCVLFIYSF